MLARLIAVRRSLPDVYWLVWLGTLVNRAGGFVMPLLGFYLTQARGLTQRQAAVIALCHGAGLVTAGLVGGSLADHLGRKSTMVISLFGGAIMMLALSGARSPVAIAATAAGLGLVGELYRPAVMAFVSDVVPAADRPRAFGWLYWVINLGFAIAPVLGGLLADWSYRALFIGDAATMASYAVIVAVWVPETRPTVTTTTTTTTVTLLSVFRDRAFMWFVGLLFLTALLFHQTTMTLSIALQDQGYRASTYGIIAASNGVIIIVVQPWLASWAARRDSGNILAAAAILAGFGVGLHGVATVVPMHLVAAMVWTTGEILQVPFVGATVSALAPIEARGRYQGVLGTAFGLGAMLASVAGAGAIAAVGPHGPWIASAIIGVIAAIGFRASAGGRRARGA